MPDFPILDAPRDNTEGRLVITDLGSIEPYIDETDWWVNMPIRVTHCATAGLTLEIGPYTLDRGDIARLRNAIRHWDIADHGPHLHRIK